MAEQIKTIFRKVKDGSEEESWVSKVVHVGDEEDDYRSWEENEIRMNFHKDGSVSFWGNSDGVYFYPHQIKHLEGFIKIVSERSNPRKENE